MPRSWMLSIASDFLSNSFLGEIPDLLGLQPLHGCGIVGSVCLSPRSRLRRQLGATRQNPYEVHRDRARIAQRAIGRHERVLPERAIARWRRRIAR